MEAGSLRDRVAASAKAASWLTPADQAALELAYRLAAQIDYLPEDASARDLTTLSVALNTVLNDLRLTPGGRSVKPQPAREVTPLAHIRAAGPVRIADPEAANATKS